MTEPEAGPHDFVPLSRMEHGAMSNLPRLRLELDAARHAIVTVLDERHEDLKRMIEQAVEHAIPRLQEQIQAAVDRALAELVEDAVDRAKSEAGETLAESLSRLVAEDVRQAVEARFK